LFVGIVGGYKNIQARGGVIPMIVPSMSYTLPELGKVRIGAPNLQGLHLIMEF
jgi:hypothetical protein